VVDLVIDLRARVDECSTACKRPRLMRTSNRAIDSARGSRNRDSAALGSRTSRIRDHRAGTDPEVLQLLLTGLGATSCVPPRPRGHGGRGFSGERRRMALGTGGLPHPARDRQGAGGAIAQGIPLPPPPHAPPPPRAARHQGAFATVASAVCPSKDDTPVAIKVTHPPRGPAPPPSPRTPSPLPRVVRR
jgi:hypothetical protein